MAGKPTYKELEQRNKELAIEVNKLKLAVLISGGGSNLQAMIDQIEAALTCLDRVDILMPVARKRGPADLSEKIARRSRFTIARSGRESTWG